MEKIISGAYIYKEKRQSKNLESVWQGVYKDKERQASTQAPSVESMRPSEKHRMYCETFRELGFFDGLDQVDKPIIFQAGVGHGKTLRVAIEQVTGAQPLGLDISYLALKNSQTNGLDRLIQGDILELPFRDKSVDRIFEVGVVEHLYTNDPFGEEVVSRKAIVDSFIELRRIMKDDGKVGFIQPSKHSTLGLSNNIDKLMGKWPMGFQEDFSITEFCELMSIAGFSNIRYNVIQAPNDFKLPVKVGDRVLKTLYTAMGDYRKAELIGALFTVVADK